jgi:hypothetical protein
MTTETDVSIWDDMKCSIDDFTSLIPCDFHRVANGTVSRWLRYRHMADALRALQQSAIDA